jgi:transcriptional regulator with XRE-family HTH domain
MRSQHISDCSQVVFIYLPVRRGRRRLRQREPRGTAAWQSSQPIDTQSPLSQARTLLSRGSRVRVAAGAPVPKEFASFDREEISRRTHIEQNDQSCEIAPNIARFVERRFSSANNVVAFFRMWRTARKVGVSSGLVFWRSLYEFRDEWHREHVNALRQLRRNANLSQQQCAELLGVPVNTFRMWDSGLRPIPCGVIERVTVSLTEHARDTEPLSLDQFASEFCVHERTLRAAARSGRLVVHLSSQSAFGRPIRRATRQAGQGVHGALLQEIVLAVRN